MAKMLFCASKCTAGEDVKITDAVAEGLTCYLAEWWKKVTLILHIPAVCQLAEFCCALTLLPNDLRAWDACCVSG